MYLFVGSGDISDLLAGTHTDAHLRLWNKFLNKEPPNYNALNSPIDAFRTGAILEERYYLILADGYLPQKKVINPKMNALKVTLDFSLSEGNTILDFDELKSVNFNDFMIIGKYKNSKYNIYIEFIKKYYKKYYNQVQSQIFSTGLESANLVFLCVYSYVDSDNYNRNIKENECLKFRIYRDDIVISEIENRLTPFQQVKDFYTKRNYHEFI